MDSELQIGLVALGVIAVVGIVAYNKWQERKHRKQAEDAFRSDHRDVLLETPAKKSRAERLEPRLDDEDPAPADPSPSVETVSAPRPAAGGVRSGRRDAPGLPDSLDPRIDCVIRVEAIEPLEAPRLWAAQREHLQDLGKPVRWFGFDDSHNLWRELNAQSASAHHWFCAAIQMVDRKGPIDERTFRQFSDGVQRIADLFLAVPAEVPTCAKVLSQAAEMDQLCASVDVQIGVNVVSNGAPFPGTKIRALAEAGGMQLADDGAFHAVDEDGNSQFILCNLEASLFATGEMRNLQTHGVTFVIDVPLVGDGVRTFDRMMRLAEQMAETLGASVVDDNRAPFGPEAATLIRSQIHQFQARMAANAIPAGSQVAARLFSA